MFADRADIHIRSGKGGDGCVAFRRELFVAAGGPNGGDGGRGGDVVFEVDRNVNTLTDYRYVRKYSAQNGENGRGNNCTGADGADVVLKVPEGTVIKEKTTGKVIADMSNGNTREVVLKGGRGGKGNQHYATSTMQVPQYAQPGQDATELDVILELKVIADVGLVGFPNVGKSTFLSMISNAKPKIANYHFTTLSPNLGVVDLKNGDGFVVADIPGLIEGASEGVGLGLDFLRHIERCKVLIHIVDAAGTEGRDAVNDIYAINKELEAYKEKYNMKDKPWVIAANKLDVLYGEEKDIAVQLLTDEFGPKGIKVFPISAATGEGVDALLFAVNSMLKSLPDDPVVFEKEFFPETLEKDSEPYFVNYDEDEEVYVIEGPRIEKMLGYTNLDSEKGFEFFQNFLKTNGILEDLEKLGIKDGDTVKMYGWTFDYYK
ncbi:MAG: GTPase ObgE [Lachnospiraceae bacterium]|nr:GTPase ObgE [Lachnospiraceae bacterium]